LITLFATNKPLSLKPVGVANHPRPVEAWGIGFGSTAGALY